MRYLLANRQLATACGRNLFSRLELASSRPPPSATTLLRPICSRYKSTGQLLKSKPDERRQSRPGNSAQRQRSPGPQLWQQEPSHANRNQRHGARNPKARKSVSLTYSLDQAPPLPPLDELPGQPDLSTSDQLIDAVKFYVEILDGKVNIQTSEVRHRVQKARVSAKIPGKSPIVTYGESLTSRKEAGQAAFQSLLAQIHRKGLLKCLPAYCPVSDDALSREKTAILDVFNYAAAYGLIPRISYPPTARKFYSYRIELPEHEIDAHVAARVSKIHILDTAAATEFKKQAERYHQKMGTGALVVKNATTLSTDNINEFKKYFSAVHRSKGTFEVSVKKYVHNAFVAFPTLRGEKIDPSLGDSNGIVCSSKSKAESAAFLVGALQIMERDEELKRDFKQALEAGKGQFLRKVHPVDLPMRQQSVHEMRRLAAEVSRARRDDAESYDGSDNADGLSRHTRSRRRLAASEHASKSAELQNRLETYRTSAELEQLRKTRSDLPMSQYAPQVQDIVRDNIYSVIIGATGSGKTTQVPQILLDEAIQNGTGAECNVVCTQPRRIAATSVARRVADERAEPLQRTVGYHVRGDVKLPQPGGSVLYCTTGILLQQLQNSPDDVYDNVSHLVIDEVHERDMIIDFLLVVLKKTMTARVAAGKKVPRVVLMSATINAESFATYFRGSLPSDQAKDCPTLSVPGRTFPVKERYLEEILPEIQNSHSNQALALLQDKETNAYLEAEKSGLNNAMRTGHSQELVIDWKNKSSATDDGEVDNKNDALIPLGLAALTIAHIAKTTSDGAILVFLPGLDEITSLDSLLRTDSRLGVDFNDTDRFRMHMLHSSIPDQRTVFDPIPDGCRKIILSTNIAETSVTIPDVQFVVDTGKSREKRYDQVRRITRLQCTWISQSNAKQRAGRAGRVQNGNYYALYTRQRRDELRAVGLPELLRSDLQEVCLDVKSQAFQMPVREFLAEALEPPPATGVDSALQNLVSLGALTAEETLTPLGRLLAQLPVHPTLGKMIVLGIIFKCLDPMIILGAATHERDIFIRPLDRRAAADAARKRFGGQSNSDHLATLNAFYAAREAEKRGMMTFQQVTQNNYLHRGAFTSISRTAEEIEQILRDAQLIDRNDSLMAAARYGGHKVNVNSDSEQLVKALLVAGLYPNIALQHKMGMMLRTQSEASTHVHMSSINNGELRRDDQQRLVVYTTMALSQDGGRINLRDTTFIHPLAALLLGGRLVHDGPIVRMDQWLPFWIKVTSGDSRYLRDGVNSLVFLRRTLDSALAAAFGNLAQRQALTDDSVRDYLVTGIRRILERETGTPEDQLPQAASSSLLDSASASQGFSRINDDDGRQSQGFDRFRQRSYSTSFPTPLNNSNTSDRERSRSADGFYREGSFSYRSNVVSRSDGGNRFDGGNRSTEGFYRERSFSQRSDGGSRHSERPRRQSNITWEGDRPSSSSWTDFSL